jgi:predicted nucleic acid-binding protein
MTTYVVDTTIVIKRLVKEIYTPNVKTLFRSLAEGDELLCPEFCLVECTNVLWKHVRFHGMPQATAEETITRLLDLPLSVESVGRLLPRALQVGLAHNLAVYDALYITMAEDLDCSLITVDDRQAKAAAAIGVALKPITDFGPET